MNYARGQINQPTKLMNKKNILSQVFLLMTAFCCAQTGSFRASFTAANGSKVQTIQLSIPLLKFNNSHGYWFINPHNGDRHLQYAPEQGWADRGTTAAYITINETKNDFDVYSNSGNDSNVISCQDKEYVIMAPAYDVQAGDKNKPMHVHINSFSASECSFTISGAARLQSINGYTWLAGTVQGSGHVYREPLYEKSDVLPGCDCDPTIYAKVYDEENNTRTASACENALKNKIFDAVQKAMMPLFTNMAANGKSKMEAGDINISILAGHVDISVPVKERAWCSSDYRGNWLTSMDAHKKYYTNEDGYGLRCIKMPDNAVLNGGSDNPDFIKKRTAFMETSMKQVMAGRMTAEQYEKEMNTFTLRETGKGPVDYKQEEVAHNLYITVMINPFDRESMLVKLGDKNNSSVQHHVKGAAFEVFTGQIKESDGSWISNRYAVYLGKFDPAVAGRSGGGYSAYVTRAAYPANGNKLSVYNIIVKLEGSKEMADKALANINFDSLEKLITRQ
jgi:hypothetical protein